MDPDGLSIVICVVLGLCSLLAAYWAGGALAGDDEREKPSRLGFSDRAAGMTALFFVLFGAFFWQLCDELKHHALLLWAIPGLLVFVLICVVVFSFGFAGAQKGKGKFGDVLGMLLTAPAKLSLKLAGISANSNVTEEELMNMVEDVEEQSLIDENQKKMIASIVEFDDVTAVDVMTHRTEIVSVADTANIGDVVRLAMAEGISRIPVYHKTLDDVVGMLHVKDLFGLWDDPARSSELASNHMRKAMFVPEA
ncbi:CBS domain-containing protein, partial [uncultured Ruthenibacterium sp.]|uniref:CBS domain-containing protein n=1 Tax=uncultured Ruthenibacterium sp. TaxID=1905347 RepID=UPI00349E4D24